MIRRLAVACLFFSAGVAGAATISAPAELHFRIAPARADNVAAFYEARGFPADAVRALSEACVIGVSIRNRAAQVVWLDLDQWRLTDERGVAVQRVGRESWMARLEALGVDQRHRATFGWTQLPERRDLHPDEPVAGNILIAPTAGRLRLEADFVMGANRDGRVLRVVASDLTCRASKED